jgi:3-methyladenine DNA glycosylase Tag
LERLWFVSVDTARLRFALRGALAVRVRSEIVPAALEAGIRVIDSSVVPCGIRAIVRCSSARQLRGFVRRLTALAANPGLPWRAAFRAAVLGPRNVHAARTALEAMRATSDEAIMTRAKAGSKRPSNARAIAALIRKVESAVDEQLGADEAARRLRHYIADHDAPADDRAAFERLCIVIFAQGLDFGTVLARAAALRAAFDGFEPASVARFDRDRVAALAAAPIIRNEAKIGACVENARRWVDRAGDSSYLARIADLAAKDDATAGWPALAAVLREDFTRLGDSAARQTLKRWGFFTALAHPGARRALERLGHVAAGTDDASVQRLIGGTAQKLGRDPYAVEAVLALFAGVGPCRKTPECAKCGVAERCPSATL